MSNSDNRIKFIDLFAGIGGMRIAFERVGMECIFSSEFDKFAQQTYYENFNEVPSGDITNIPVEEIPSHDLLLAGFPCQPFSVAGKKGGFDDTRGTLFFNILEILDVKRPRAFLLENVYGLTFHDHGNTFRVILDSLNELGYNVKWKVLSAKDFGLPQNRKRIYIVGFLEENNFDFPSPLGIETRVGNILESCVDNRYTISDEMWDYCQRRKEENELHDRGFVYGMVTKDSEYTRTLKARYYDEILLEQEGKNPRKLTPRECARLQGFPDSFKINVSMTQAYKQFGNSVSIPVVEAIAKEMSKILLLD